MTVFEVRFVVIPVRGIFLLTDCVVVVRCVEFDIPSCLDCG
jgi:hypothetical protein